MADKPSSSLVLYGDGLARSVNPSHANLHSLARRASCGFLSLAPTPQTAETEDERIIRELAQLLDASEVSIKSGECLDELELPKLSQRFMGMRAALVTENLSLKSFADKLGCNVLQFSHLKNHPGLPPNVVASESLKLLGFENGKTLEKSQFDFVLLHIGAGESDKKDETVMNNVEYINHLVGEVMELAQPGSEIGSRLHLSVLMSHGAVSKEDESCLSISMDKNKYKPGLLPLIPRQSYMMKGGRAQRKVREFSPMLIAQWQDAVTRKDMAEMFSFKDFKKYGGNLTIPADRFLHEVAFKLWKAPKYGA